MAFELLNTKAAAVHVALSPVTLERLRLTGDGPQYAKLTPGPRGPVRYRRADLDEWVASRLVHSTSEGA